MVSSVVLLIVALACVFATFIAPYGENEAIDSADGGFRKEILVPPNSQFWFGTDPIGRDLYSRVLYGGRVSLFVGIASAISAVSHRHRGRRRRRVSGGRIDNGLMRFTDLFLGLPLLVLLIVMRLLPEKQPWAATVLGEPGSKRLMVTLITLVAWMATARIVRGVVLSLKEKEFVEAARAVGASDRRIIVRHLVPNTIGPIVVSMTFIVAVAIGLEVDSVLLRIRSGPDAGLLGQPPGRGRVRRSSPGNGGWFCSRARAVDHGPLHQLHG